MSDEMSAQVVENAGITGMITCPEAFAIAKKVQVSLTESGGYCPSHRIGIRGCPPGCFR